MAFKTRKKEEFSYSSPQEMYQDNKFKKIMGPLDYQAAMLNLYNENADKKTVALELPTGSGKTLVGLLIGEYRRRKNKEKVLFLCPTNQLVYQVVEQANSKYGLRAIAFCGKQKDYLPKDKSCFLMGEAIGVTTYSSFFALHSFFDDVDILIMDDVHSCEDYIISNWTIQIDSGNIVFLEIAELLKPFISETDYKYLLEDEYIPEVVSWCNMLPMPLIMEKLDEFQTILQQGLEAGTSNYYAYSRISENLQECNIYIANRKLLIRPWIAPTLSFEPFAGAKQRVLMSATLGRSGELERITGIEKICRLPIVNDWDKKGLGRKFFTFPDLSLGEDEQGNVIMALQNLCKKSVFLVPDSQSAEAIRQFYAEHGKVFERGHKELGKLLGYISENPDSTGAPDPYWIINENNVIVSEDKIYEEKAQIKGVPISDVSEAGRHHAWIVEHEKRISKDANIYTILITNSKSIDEDARIYAGNIYYVYREEYVSWAIKALTVIRSVWNMFTDEGDMEWRNSVHQQFIKEGITPKNYLDFVCKKNLKDIE